jgi:hypothetical protein
MPTLIVKESNSHRNQDGTRPDRRSGSRNTVNPMGSQVHSLSKLTVRKAERPSGQRMLEEAKALGNAGDRGSNFAPR